jgi:hypothetical protein
MAVDLETGQYQEPGLGRKLVKTGLNMAVTGLAGAAVGGALGAGYEAIAGHAPTNVPAEDAGLTSDASAQLPVIEPAAPTITPLLPPEPAIVPTAPPMELISETAYGVGNTPPPPPVDYALPDARLSAAITPTSEPLVIPPELKAMGVDNLPSDPMVKLPYVGPTPTPTELTGGWFNPKPELLIDPSPNNTPLVPLEPPAEPNRYVETAKTWAQGGGVTGVAVGGITSWRKFVTDQRSRDAANELGA